MSFEGQYLGGYVGGYLGLVTLPVVVDPEPTLIVASAPIGYVNHKQEAIARLCEQFRNLPDA